MKKQIFGFAVALLALPTICFSQTSPDGSKIAAPTNNTLTDASGAVWGFAGPDPAFPLDYYVTMNGQMIQAQGYPAGIFWSMSELLILNNGQVYATDDVYGGGDYQWNGATFTQIPSLPSGGPPPSITLNGASGGTTVTAGASMSVAVANGPGNRGDWMGVCNAGVPISSTQCDGAGYSWDFLNCTQTAPPAGLTSATCSLPAPLVAGNYYAVFFSNSTYSVLASAPFQVTSPPPPPSSLGLVQTAMSHGAPPSTPTLQWAWHVTTTGGQPIGTGNTVVGYVHSSDQTDSFEMYPQAVRDNLGHSYNLTSHVHWEPWPEDIGIFYLMNVQGNPDTFIFDFTNYPDTPTYQQSFVDVALAEYSGASSLTVVNPVYLTGANPSLTISPTAPALIWAFASPYLNDVAGALVSPSSGYSLIINNLPTDDIGVWGSNSVVFPGTYNFIWYAPTGAPGTCQFDPNGCGTVVMGATVQ